MGPMNRAGSDPERAQTKFALKTPRVMMPLRVMLTGTAQAPAVDALMLTLGREQTLQKRIAI